VHVIAAKAVAFQEAMQPSFKQYAAAIVANAKSLAEELMVRGWRLVSGGTDNHLMLVDLRSRNVELTGQVAANRLDSAGIISNKNAIPFDPRPPMEASGVRLGTAALTSRGMGKPQMKQIAGWIDQVLSSGGEEQVINKVRGSVGELCRQYPIPNQGN
jgi:glycine hydroxymethyltransferase